MAIVTLITDFGNVDYYIPAFKGEVLSTCPEVRFVDLTHNVEAFNINSAAYILKNTFKSYPAGTIHIVRVNESADLDQEILVCEHEGYYFIAPNNGVLSLVFNSINIPFVAFKRSTFGNLSMDQLLCKVLKFIEEGEHLSEKGEVKKSIVEKLDMKPVIYEKRMSGLVTHIDHFGNIITNITYEDFEQGVKNRKFVINFRRLDTIDKLHQSYSDVPHGERLARFNNNKLLEISVNNGRADLLLGLRIGDSIQIEFE